MKMRTEAAAGELMREPIAKTFSPVRLFVSDEVTALFLEVPGHQRVDLARWPTCGIRSSVCVSQASGSTSFILADWMSVESVAQVLPPPAFPANRLFFRLCKDLHNRKNWLFAGSDKGGERIANILTIIETALCRARHKQVYADRRTMPIKQVFANVFSNIAVPRSA
jgi:hypothetical protein